MIATIGFFDGMHEGHRYVISQVTELAEKRGDGSVVFTFDRHPASLFCPERVPPLLLTPEEKMERIAACGVEDVVMFEFDEDFASITPREFLEIIKEDYGVTTLLLGYDNHFGKKEKNADGKPIDLSFEDYQRLGKETGVKIKRISPLPCPSGKASSSSLVRLLLLDGDIEEANKRLGYSYQLTGEVVTGKQIGRTIGFPTANIKVAEGKLVPKNGVYEVTCRGVSNTPHKALLNIGERPTFNGHIKTIEAHIINFDGDLYGQTLTIEFVRRLRDERKFDSPEELANQINQDLKVLRDPKLPTPPTP